MKALSMSVRDIVYRFLLASFGLAVVAGLFWIALFGMKPADRETLAGPHDRDHLMPLLDAVLADYDYSIASLVPGTQTPNGTWDFRGSVKKREVYSPVYGEVERVCADSTKLTCWALARLSIDGNLIEFGQTAPPTESASTALNMSDTGGDSVSSEQTETEPSTGQGSASAAENREPANALDAGSGDLWRSRSDNVRARLGPGVEHPIAFPMPSHVALRLVSQSGSWGEFEYETTAGNRAKVWIYLDLVEKIPRN